MSDGPNEHDGSPSNGDGGLNDGGLNDAAAPPPRCVELVDALWAGSCDPQQLAELEAIVVADEAARRFYIRALHLFSLLRRHVSYDEQPPVGPADLAAKLTSSEAESADWPLGRFGPQLFRPATWLFVALALVLGLYAAPWFTGSPPGGESADATPQSTAAGTSGGPAASSTADQEQDADNPEQVATVTGMHHCEWSAADGAGLRVGSRLAAGQRMRLRAGLVEITFDSQARVTLTGPAELEMTSANGAKLSVGRVSSTVPEQAVGFTLETPTGRIVDFGTQFTAEVAADRTVHAAVLRGEIEVRVDDPQHNPVHTQRLTAGQAVTIDPQGQAQSAAVAAPASTAPPAGYLRWKQHSERLQQDPSLLVYYTFEDPSGTTNPPPQLLNRAVATRGRMNGVLGNGMLGCTAPQWASGRWFDKGALLFRAAQRQVVVTPDWPLLAPRRELTLAAWVRFTRDRGKWNLIATQWAAKTPANRMLFHLGAVSPSILPNYSGTRTRLVLHMTEDGRTERIVADEAADGGATLAADGWFFVAFTATAGGPVRLFKNGTEIAAGGQVYAPAEFPQTNQPLILGGKNDDVFFLEGLIDEFAAFGRALSPDELQRFYEAGRP